MSKSTAALRALKRSLGSSVLTDHDSCYAASYDGSRLSFMPEAVVAISKEEQIGKVLKLANKYRIPVTTRGGGSSLTGSASPLKGGWVLDVSRLKKIKIDELAGQAIVQAGATIANIQEAAEKSGWFYPPDPSSRKYSTIGGNIACNAGGLRGAKYGVTRDYIVSLKGFLPTGEAVSFGRPLRKWAVGYNLRDLWIGMEGTLGVVTEATLKLIKKPEKRVTMLAAFKNEASAIRAIKSMLKDRLMPVALEFLDRTSIACLERATGKAVFADNPSAALVLVELDGDRNQLKQEEKFVREWAATYALDLRKAKNEKEAEELWDVRRGCSPAMFEFGDSKINEDIVVPLKNHIKLFSFLKKLEKETGLRVPTFGHSADGNYHVNIMYTRSNPKERKAAKKAVNLLMKKVIELGGAISGEHGIGLAKSPFVPVQYGKDEINAMLAIKKALDPAGILNPGKIFEPYEVWAQTPVQERMPWDHRKK